MPSTRKKSGYTKKDLRAVRDNPETHIGIAGLLQDDFGIARLPIIRMRYRPVGAVAKAEHDGRHDADHEYPWQQTGEATAKRRSAVGKPMWLTKADFAKARPFSEVFPDLSASIRKGRGPNKAPTKKLVSLRLSPDVVEHFKSTGPGWQSRIDETLRKAVKRKAS